MEKPNAQMVTALAHPEYGPLLRLLVRELGDDDTSRMGTDTV
ncbi:hypothetical protein ACWF9B_35480 [Streptomyces sp. NPDC055089]